MKKIFLLFFTAISIVGVNAQQPATQNCFNEYYSAFRDRGAEPVADGVNEVVVCIRKEGNCTCVLGKITVKEGKPINDLWLAKEDGTFEKFSFTPHSLYRTEVTNFENGIYNGMSPTYFSSNDESINLFFIKALKPKKGNYKQAPAIN